MSSVVLAPFVGAHDLLGVGYCSGLVEALSECVPNQGSRHGVVTADPIMDIAQQKLPLFIFSMPRSTARVTKGQQHWQGRAKGSCPGHAPVSLAPRPRNLAPP